MIYIAVALAVVGQEWERRGEKLSFYDLLLDPDIIYEVVKRSVLFALMMGRSPQFAVDADALVQIQIAE